MSWRYVDSDRSAVFRELSDGGIESMSILSNEIQEWIDAGNDILPPKELASNISASPLQIRRALNAKDKRAVVDFAISESDQDIKDYWEFSIQFSEIDPEIIYLFNRAGISSQQKQDIFYLASTL